MAPTGGITIPRWFAAVGSAVMTLAVPWAIWVSGQLLSIGVRMEVHSSIHAEVVSLRDEVARQQTAIALLQQHQQQQQQR